MVSATNISSQKFGETGLFKMMVGSKGFGNLFHLHHNEAGAIGQAPSFVRAVTVQIPSLVKQIAAERDDLYVFRLPYTFNIADSVGADWGF